MTSLLADVSDKLNGRQSVVNVIENLNFARIYWEVILSTCNKVYSFLSTIIESLGSPRFELLMKFKFWFLRSSMFQVETYIYIYFFQANCAPHDFEN